MQMHILITVQPNHSIILASTGKKNQRPHALNITPLAQAPQQSNSVVVMKHIIQTLLCVRNDDMNRADPRLSG